MKKKLKLPHKPLSPKLLEILKICQERGLADSAPLSAIKTPYCKGLITKKYCLALMYYPLDTDKKYMGLFITDAGKSYLEAI